METQHAKVPVIIDDVLEPKYHPEKGILHFVAPQIEIQPGCQLDYEISITPEGLISLRNLIEELEKQVTKPPSWHARKDPRQ